MFHINLRNSDSVFYENYRRQLAAALSVNLLVFSHGIASGWVSPMLLSLQSPESPLEFNVSVQEASWIGAFIGVGALIGNLTFGALLDLIGRKKCLCLLAVPNVFFWVMVFLANNVNYLYMARLLAGFTAGGAYGVIPIFVSEIADLKIRGTLGAIFCFSLNIGMLSGNIIASHVPYLIIPSIVVVLPVLYLIFVVRFPETPQFLIGQEQFDEAEKSLKYYKNIKENDKDKQHEFQIDFSEMKMMILSSENKESFALKDFCAKRSVKGLLIGIVLMIVFNWTGILTILNYSSVIFAEVNSSMDPNTNTIILGAFQILGSYCAFLLIDKYGRRFLMLVSTVGMCITFTMIGVHSYMVTHMSFTGARWLPIVLMSFLILLANIGVLSVTFILLVEVLPPKIRSFGTASCLVLSSILVTIVLKAFPVLMIIIGLSGVMWIFASVSAFGFIFFLVFMEETKGKNLNDESTYN